MRVFVTGASGWIGSGVVPALTRAGHEVVGLARSQEAAARVEALGARARRGSLDDSDTLGESARECDAVIHLGYVHDFSRMDEAAALDRRVLATFADALADSGKTLMIAAGVAGFDLGRPATESDEPAGVHPRVANAAYTLGLSARGLRPVVLRFPPTVHGRGDHGFIARLVEIARERGVSGYVADGASAWSAVHRDDAARAVCAALTSSVSVVHAVADEGVASRDIATAIGRGLDLPVVSIAPESAASHFGWLGLFFAMDARASSEQTRRALDWEPREPGLLEDLALGHYFASASDTPR